MNRLKLIFAPSLAVWLAAVVPAMGMTIHVSPKGDDAGPGSREKPVATINRAVAMAQDAKEQVEIIVGKGRYFERVDLKNPTLKEGQPPEMVLRAEEGEEVVLDGSQSLMGATPMPGEDAVYRAQGNFKEPTPPQVWESGSRKRYIGVADAQAVKAFEGTVAVLDPQSACFRLTGGRTLADSGVLSSKHVHGIFSTRDNLRIKGLKLENYLGWSWAAGITIQEGRNVVVEDCAVSNAVRGFVAYTKANKTQFVRCRVSDVGTGIYCAGQDVEVRDCVLVKVRDKFMVAIDNQDDSAIQYYSPATGGTVRGNIIQGFRCAIFIKASPGTYTVENNTIVLCGSGVFYNLWHAPNPTVIRHNIIWETDVGLMYPPAFAMPVGACFDENLVWATGALEAQLKGNLAEMQRAGNGMKNVMADPQFASPGEGKFWLKETSPANVSSGGKAWGALPKEASGQLAEPLPIKTPDVRNDVETVIQPTEMQARPAYVWLVAHNGKDEPGRGQSDAPMASLAFALSYAQAGDVIRLAPGIYRGRGITLKRSGTRQAPITIEALTPGTVILDGLKQTEAILTIRDANHIKISNIQFRWFIRNGIQIERSSNITVEGCTFINHFWNHDFTDGTAVWLDRSPDCTLTGNIVGRMDKGFYLSRSPGAVVSNNSATRLMYGGLWLVDSSQGTRVENNAFCFAGNDAVLIHEQSADAFASLQMDYNNWASSVQSAAKPLKLPFDYMSTSKAVVTAKVAGYVSSVKLTHEDRLLSLEDWQKFSGKDKHSLFADPRWIDPAAGNWSLGPDSPNLKAGVNGQTIGATGLASGKQP